MLLLCKKQKSERDIKHVKKQMIQSEDPAIAIIQIKDLQPEYQYM